MKTLFLIRHAKSSWDDPLLSDKDRPLNKRGHRDAPFMGQLLAEKGVQPDLLLSSHANRAFTTALYFASALGMDRDVVLVDEAIYEASPGDLFRIIQQLPDEKQVVLLFGHNPGFTLLANYFQGFHFANVPTCGIVQLDLDIDKWQDMAPEKGRMSNFYFPKQYFS